MSDVLHCNVRLCSFANKENLVFLSRVRVRVSAELVSLMCTDFIFITHYA